MNAAGRQYEYHKYLSEIWRTKGLIGYDPDEWVYRAKYKEAIGMKMNSLAIQPFAQNQTF